MTTIKFRRDTSANWTSVNPIPAQGEPCYETDTGKLKIGNGSDNYTALPYVSDDGGDLPIASTTRLGVIKVGDNLNIAADGTLSAGASGTTDYTQLENKPQINSVELTGNKTLDDLGIQAKGDYQPAGDYAATGDIPTKTSQLTNDSGFLTEAPVPDNMVTTDTAQTITGGKTFSNVTVNDTAFIGNEITFNSASTSRHINNVASIGGGYHVTNGYLTFEGTTTLTGDDKLVLDGRNGGIILQADSGKMVTVNNILLCSAGLYSDAVVSTAGKSIIAANTDKSVSVGQYQYNTILNNPVVAYTSTANSSLYFSNFLGNRTKDCITYNNGAIEIYAASGTAGTTEGTSFRVTDSKKTDLLSVDFNGNITGNGKTYINSENIDTTYMKWDTTNKKLTVDTAAVAHLAMPSNTSVDLTLGASGTQYTAPADGYVSVSATSSYTGWIKVDTRPGCYAYANSGQFLINTPVNKDVNFKVWYSFSSGNVETLQYAFYYCNGTKPV